MPTPQISVIIAAGQDESPALLRRSVLSAVRQKVDATVRVFVQVDGSNPEVLSAALQKMEVGQAVSVRALGEQVGPAATRNEALAWLDSGCLVATLDSDDWLPPLSLASRLDALRSGNSLWSAGQVLMKTGDSEKQIKLDLPSGLVSTDEVTQMLRKPAVTLPPHVAVLCPVEAWWSVGGFAGLVYGEDDVALSALFTKGPGIILDDIVYMYERRTSGESLRRTREKHQKIAATKERWRRLRIGLPPP